MSKVKLPEPTYHEAGPTDHLGRSIEYTKVDLLTYGEQCAAAALAGHHPPELPDAVTQLFKQLIYGDFVQTTPQT